MLRIWPLGKQQFAWIRRVFPVHFHIHRGDYPGGSTVYIFLSFCCSTHPPNNTYCLQAGASMSSAGRPTNKMSGPSATANCNLPVFRKFPPFVFIGRAGVRPTLQSADNLVGNFELRCDFGTVMSRRFEPGKGDGLRAPPVDMRVPCAISDARVSATVKTAIRGCSILVTH